jgi:hypothetical protein
MDTFPNKERTQLIQKSDIELSEILSVHPTRYASEPFTAAEEDKK